MRCLVLQHLAFEDLGTFAPVLLGSGWSVRACHVADGLPAARDWLDADLCVVLGGPMGVHDGAAYPFLSRELELVRSRLAAGSPLLGICLGAQLMAQALGAAVYPGTAREIGWGGLQLTDAGAASPLGALRAAPVLHWHGDTFDLPPGAVLLASTDITPHQAFRAGAGQLALQFHAEADAARMEHWLMGHACELAAARLDVAAIREDARVLGGRAAAAGQDFFRRWLGSVFTA